MIDPLFDLSDRVIVVTGGLGQLGRQWTDALVQRGARIAILDRCATTNSVDQSRLLISADVTNRASLEAALERVREHWGEPFGLINAAALDSAPDANASENGPFEEVPEHSWEQVIEVNLKGVFLACQVFGAAMANARRGSIVNVGSVYGLVSPDQRLYAYRRQRGEMFFKPVAYAVSKSGLLNLTRYLATYWAPHGVRVNTVSFGGVFNYQDPEFVDAYCERVPLGRMARDDDYNGALVFLMSAASEYMTGANLVIDGGFTAW